MKLVVTGGGTGGHVFPALETALEARALGWEVAYLGSLRGQESEACRRADVAFQGFPSGPVYKPLTPRGLKSLLGLLKATAQAARALARDGPDAVFATGGYAAAPVLSAARRLRIPIVIHEQNSTPGRTNKMMGSAAYKVCTVFQATAAHFPAGKTVRTGMPIRKALRASAQGTLMMDASISSPSPLVLVMGGSQGSAALNDLALATAVRMAKKEVQWLHVAGTGHFESTMNTLRKMAVRSDYVLKSYLDADEMASAIFNSALAVCRSGAGTLSELAAFRRPAVLIPYPHAFGNHQLHNAMEFQEMGAAEVIEERDVQPASLEVRIHAWLFDKDRHAAAQNALAAWDIVDSVPRILSIIEEAAQAR